MSIFNFLEKKSSLFYKLCKAAEDNFSSDPNTTLIKLRQFAEAVAQDIAARSGIQQDYEISQNDLLFRIGREIRLERTVLNLFHHLRKEGNRATHEFRTQHREAMDGLRVARELAAWYQKAFIQPNFTLGTFIKPKDPSEALRVLQEEIQKLKADAQAKSEELEASREMQELLNKEKAEYEQLANEMDAEAKTYSELAAEVEQALEKQRKEFEQEIERVRKEALEDSGKVKTVVKQTQKASKSIVLNEELTRILIDQQLKENGWEADSEELTFAKGYRLSS